MAGPYFLIRIRIPLCEKILFWSMTLNSWIRIWKKWTEGIRKIAVKEGTGTRTYANIMKYLNGGKHINLCCGQCCGSGSGQIVRIRFRIIKHKRKQIS